MPTHSIHNRIAFAITVFASPRQMPKPIIKTAANSGADWAIAFLFITCGCSFLFDEISIHLPV